MTAALERIFLRMASTVLWLRQAPVRDAVREEQALKRARFVWNELAKHEQQRHIDVAQKLRDG
jgi:hypothetical protein